MDFSLTTLQSHAAGLFSAGGFAALANILLIDLIMSGDNAIMIGMAVRSLHGRTRRLAITAGIALATVLRITLACFATLLLSVTGLQLAGGLLLLYVVWKFYRELRHPHSEGQEEAAGTKPHLWAAIWTIILADVSMSLDNVLAVAGASHGNLVALGAGLVISILLMAIASNLVAKFLDRCPWLQWAGLLAILFVAAEMMLNGSASLSERLGGLRVLPAVTILSAIIFSVLHSRSIRPPNEAKVKAWLHLHRVLLLIILGVLITALAILNHTAWAWLLHHEPVVFVLVTLLLGLLLDLIALYRGNRD